LHASPHEVPSQVALPFGSVGQGVHDDGPHEVTLVFDAHWVPHRWAPAAQVAATHTVPEQAKAVAFAVGQGAHPLPHNW
jgi:hypothetical protein